MQIVSVKSVAYIIFVLYYFYDKLDTNQISINIYQDNSVFGSIYIWAISLLKSKTIFFVLTLSQWLNSIISIMNGRPLLFGMQPRIQFILFFIFISESDLISSTFVSFQELILLLIQIYNSRTPRNNFKSLLMLITVLSFTTLSLSKNKLHDLLQLLWTYFLLNLWLIPLYFLIFFSHTLMFNIEESYNNTIYNLPQNIGNKLIFLMHHREKIYSANRIYASLFLSIFVIPELFFQISNAVYPNCLFLIQYLVLYLYSLPIAFFMNLYYFRSEFEVNFINTWALLFSLVFYREIFIYLFDIDFMQYKWGLLG